MLVVWLFFLFKVACGGIVNNFICVYYVYGVYLYQQKQTTMKNITEIAERIYKANKTLAINAELVKLNGGHNTPASLALNAARLVINGKTTLNFNY